MKTQPLTNEKAIEYWTELHRLISVGAYEERSAEQFETDTWPEDGVEESVHNLEEWAASKGLEFCWNQESKSYSLEPIEQAEPPDLVVEQMNRIEAPGYNELGEDEPLYSFPNDEEEYISSDGGLHQCEYCYNLVSEGHEEFCSLNPHRNRNIVP